MADLKWLVDVRAEAQEMPACRSDVPAKAVQMEQPAKRVVDLELLACKPADRAVQVGPVNAPARRPVHRVRVM